MSTVYAMSMTGTAAATLAAIAVLSIAKASNVLRVRRPAKSAARCCRG
jgi:hypothetical protein